MSKFDNTWMHGMHASQCASGCSSHVLDTEEAHTLCAYSHVPSKANQRIEWQQQHASVAQYVPSCATTHHKIELHTMLAASKIAAILVWMHA